MAGGAGGAESGAMSMMGAGAMLGSLIPGVGTAVGAVVGGIGGAVLGAFFGGQPERYYLTDLNIPTSRYGTGISQVFGTARVSGNIIWAGTAQAQMESVGGKGSK